MKAQENTKVLFLDFCSEKNRGDAAMQVGILKLAQKYFSSETEFSAISVFGTNQIDNIHQQHDHTSKMDIKLLGGLKSTFYPLEEDNKRGELLIEILNSLSFLLSLFLLLLVYLNIPNSLIVLILPSQTRKTYLAIVEADVVIWNGRNIRSRKNRLLEIYRTLHNIYHPLLAIALSKPIACVGISVWELNSSIARFCLKIAFANCHFISTRENKSYTAIKNLLGPNNEKSIVLLPDLSFAAYDDIDQIIQNRNSLSKTDFPKKIGLTIVDWKSDGEEIRTKYKRAIQETISYFVEKGSQIILIPQVTKKWEHFSELLEEILVGLEESIREKIEVIGGELSVNELLNVYAKLDFLIATRMHSAIFASAVQTPIVAISYDDGGKWSILEKLGYTDFIIPYSEVSSSNLINNIEKCWEQKETLLEDVQFNVKENIKKVELNISLIKEFSDNLI